MIFFINNLPVPTNPVPFLQYLTSSNGNASETKANESFDNGVFFDIDSKKIIFETKRTH